jgi:hypothetical protein
VPELVNNAWSSRLEATLIRGHTRRDNVSNRPGRTSRCGADSPELLDSIRAGIVAMVEARVR